MGRSNIEWCDYTWNPITGCLHGCPYCYARSIARRFSGNIKANFAKARNERILNCEFVLNDPLAETGWFELKEPVLADNGRQVIYPFGFAPTFHEYRLDDIDKPIGGKNIFVGAMADVFGDWVQEEWILRILDKAEQTPRHNYLFLTKNPGRMLDLANEGVLPRGANFWYGTTITKKHGKVFQHSRYHTFISIEPLHEFLELRSGGLGRCEWVIIGAETGKSKDKVVPDKGWVDNILYAADHGDHGKIPVFMKDSLIPIVGEENMRREFPEQLQRHEPGKKYKELFYSRCVMCGKEAEKKTMITLSAKKGRGGEMKTLCQVCEDCFAKVKEEIGKREGGNNG